MAYNILEKAGEVLSMNAPASIGQILCLLAAVAAWVAYKFCEKKRKDATTKLEVAEAAAKDRDEKLKTLLERCGIYFDGNVTYEVTKIDHALTQDSVVRDIVSRYASQPPKQKGFFNACS